ncbi:hypothetical protein C8F01DRAFT_1170972, partial [Mycena amicta]
MPPGTEEACICKKPERQLPPIHTWTNHPDFYFADTSFVKLFFLLVAPDGASALRYCLPTDSLALRSSFFADMFTLPHTGGSIEGKTDGNPITLPHTISREILDALLTYILWGPSKFPRTRTFLMQLMEASDFFGVPDGIDYAKNEFDRRAKTPNLPLAEWLDGPNQFYLARRFHLDSWIAPAFRRLLIMSWMFIQPSKIELIGEDTVALVLRTLAKLKELRDNMAFNAPQYKEADTCERRARCESSWASTWEHTVARLIHHPD